MPEATLHAVADHGAVPADSIRGTYDQAQHVLDHLAAVGVDYVDVVTHLEDDAVAKFDAAWDHVGEQLAASLAAHGGQPAGRTRHCTERS